MIDIINILEYISIIFKQLFNILAIKELKKITYIAIFINNF